MYVIVYRHPDRLEWFADDFNHSENNIEQVRKRMNKLWERGFIVRAVKIDMDNMLFASELPSE